MFCAFKKILNCVPVIKVYSSVQVTGWWPALQEGWGKLPNFLTDMSVKMVKLLKA